MYLRRTQYPPVKHVERNRTDSTKFIRDLEQVPKNKDKINGVRAADKARDLLSRTAVDVLRVGHPRMLQKKSVAGRVIMDYHVCAPIAMYGICWNVKTWNWVLKHRLLKMKDVPVCLGNRSRV
jgi:hypothetical protein